MAILHMLRRVLPASLAWLSLVWLTTACGSPALRLGHRAFEAGQYEQAASYYAHEAARRPDDQALGQRLWAARALALRDVLTRFAAARSSQAREQAMRELARALLFRDRWYVANGRPVPSAQAAELGAALDWASSIIGARTEQALLEGRPLVAELVLEGEGRVLAASELRETTERLRQRVTEAGRTRCVELASGEDTTSSPYLARVVSAYCMHFGHAPLTVGAGPEQVSSVAVSVALSGPVSGSVESTQALIRDVFARTPFFHPEARAEAQVALQAQLSSARHVATATRERPWFERVAYEEQEAFVVPVQEPYLETENYTERVPYTAYEQRSEPCTSGSSSSLCSRSVPVTRYRDEWRTRLVTRYRTRYDQHFRTVTRYREEPRVFRYTVEEHTVEHGIESHGTITAPGIGAPIAVHWADRRIERGDRHDALFAPAGVAPETPSFTDDAGWLDHASRSLPGAVYDAALEAWAARYCSTQPPSDLSLSQAAARCAHGARGSLPGWADHALSALLRDDWNRLRRMLPPS